MRNLAGVFGAVAVAVAAVAPGLAADSCEGKFAWRGFMLDEARHFFGKEAVKSMLDKMAELKLNRFHWHLTDDQGWRLDIPGMPELVKYGAVRPWSPIPGTEADSDHTQYGPFFYTAADVKEIVDYAAKRGITVVPEIEIPGHARALLAAHPEFACPGTKFERTPFCEYGICTNVVCAGNDEMIAYYKRIFDEVMKLFPGEYIHIGGDECPRGQWQGCAKCKRRIESEKLAGFDELQGWITRQMVEYISAKGRRAIGWDEILECGELPKGTIVQSWRGTKGGIAAAKKGYDVIMSPVNYLYFSIPEGRPDDHYQTRYYSRINKAVLPASKVRSFNPLAGIPPQCAKHILGAECCAWTEVMHTPEELRFKTFNRLEAFAEIETATAKPDGVPLDGAFLKGELDKVECFYKVGEEITFTVKLEGAGKGLKADDWQMKWERLGEDGQDEKGVAPIPVDKPFVYKTKSAKPGTVRLLAQVTDKSGKVYRKNIKPGALTPDGRRPMNWAEVYDKRVFFDGSALVEPEKLEQVPEPADFDAFWAKQKARLAAVPLKVLEYKQIQVAGPNADVFAVKLSCAGERPVTGYLSLPKSRASGKKFPAKLDVDGYGCGKPRPYDGGLGRTEILFHINAHGFDLDKDDQYYKDFSKSINVDKTSYAFSEKQNSDPETAYFNGMALRVMRALEYLKTLPEWDGKHLLAYGGSQGGLQSIWAAGLDKDVNDIVSEITWCCDMGGEKMGRLRGGWYIKGTDALRYYDPINHAKRINPAAKLNIRRAGLGDYTCPPWGLWKLYDVTPCEKRIHWVQGSSHGYMPPPPYQQFDVTNKKAEEADAHALDTAFLLTELDKVPSFYKVGEEITFTIKMVGAGAGLKADDWLVEWELQNDCGQDEKGVAPLPIASPLVVKAKTAKPGTVRLIAVVKDKAKHQTYWKNVKPGALTPDGRRPMNSNERGDRRIFFDGCALVEPEKVEQVAEPKDFDEFWARQKARNAAVPLKPELTKVEVKGTAADVYNFSIPCAGPRPATGCISIPKGKGHKFRISIGVDGYGVMRPWVYQGSTSHEISIHLFAHGFEMGRDDQYYKDFAAKIKKYAFDETENADPEKAYFNGMALRLMRTIEWAKTLPEWNGKDIAISGGSQGGLQAIWAAGLDKDVTDIISDITWCCDIGGEQFERLRGSSFRPKYTDALRYYDTVNHAKRVNPAAKVNIRRAGLGDTCCPPMGLWLLYNALPCEKKIHWVQGSSHGYMPPPPYQSFDLTNQQ